MQKPKPHGVAADEPERDLLEEKPAESDLNRLAHAPPLLQAIEDKLQPQSGDETGLAREYNEQRHHGENAQLVPVGCKKGKIDLRNDDQNCKKRDRKLAGGNHQSSGGGCAAHDKTPKCTCGGLRR